MAVSASAILNHPVALDSATPPSLSDDQFLNHASHRSHKGSYAGEKLLARIFDWLKHEREKASRRKKHVSSSRRKSKSPPKELLSEDATPGSSNSCIIAPTRRRSSSVDSQSSEVSFDRLQRILEDGMSSLGLSQAPAWTPGLGRHRSSHKRLPFYRAASSDTEYVDGDLLVPSCDAFLDISKTMSYSGGHADDDTESTPDNRPDKTAWLSFKTEILRLAHTLRLKGWRRIPLDRGDRVSVQRLSGALTNAVYVVTPPADMEDAPGKKIPSKLLLRVYGSQVDQIIDRETELAVLRRLARKKIGPRLLGTFTNGRFEQFFDTITLTPEDLREPETSKQIAKRMRELHDGVELLYEEIESGPGVWRNWDRWLPTLQTRMQRLDKLTSNGHYVCGTPWEQFQTTVEKYRGYIDQYYGSRREIQKRLVFAHNDTQYGNILRVKPDCKKSPLLQPANQHKQLIVIDFEYAAANVCGFEFANHFNEWAYNYHDPVAPHKCNTHLYPTVPEQRRFLKAYVEHRPQFPQVSSPPGESTPSFVPVSSSSSIVDFMLDARGNLGDYRDEEKARQEEVDRQVQHLLEETRLWRAANSAFWVSWGIMQAPQYDKNEGNPQKAEGEEFDYLGYSHERALFFWGDCVLMGLVKQEDLPPAVASSLKFVEH